MIETTYSSYAESLRDPRWQKKRLEICEAAGWRCEDCKRPDKPLEVHHSYYIRAFRNQPWKYDNTLLMCLCSDCHEFRAGREEAMFLHLAATMRAIPMNQLEEVAWDFIHDAIKKAAECRNANYAPS